MIVCQYFNNVTIQDWWLTYMSWNNGILCMLLSLVQVLSTIVFLFGATPLYEKIQRTLTLFFKKMQMLWKVSFAKLWPFCPCLDLFKMLSRGFSDKAMTNSCENKVIPFSLLDKHHVTIYHIIYALLCYFGLYFETYMYFRHVYTHPCVCVCV